MLFAATVKTSDELRQILELQQLYLKGKNTSAEENEQGFLTVQHSFDMLRQMHRFYPSVVVKDQDKVVAYALVMTTEAKDLVPVLIPMFEMFEKMSYKNRALNSYRYYVIGQICIAREYRGKGLMEMLYQKHKETYWHQFDFVITEISSANQRSLKAHQRIGFKTISTHRDDTDEWHVVLWDWQ